MFDTGGRWIVGVSAVAESGFPDEQESDINWSDVIDTGDLVEFGWKIHPNKPKNLR